MSVLAEETKEIAITFNRLKMEYIEIRKLSLGMLKKDKLLFWTTIYIDKL
jgi:hypothetical protein